VALLALEIAGCGSDDNDSSVPLSPAKDPAMKKALKEKPSAFGASKFTDESKNAYDIGKASCGSFSPQQLAKQLGTKSDPNTSVGLGEIAMAYAEGYRGDVHQAAFEGCLDALPNPSG
jgi:hypothetical protein